MLKAVANVSDVRGCERSEHRASKAPQCPEGYGVIRSTPKAHPLYYLRKQGSQLVIRRSVRAKRARGAGGVSQLDRRRLVGQVAALAAAVETSLHVALHDSILRPKFSMDFGLNSKIPDRSRSCTDHQSTKRPASISTHIFVILSQYRICAH